MPHPYLLFLTSHTPPTPAQIEAQLGAIGHRVTHHPDYVPNDEMAGTWNTLGLLHSPDHPPLIVEAERRNGAEGHLVRQEVKNATARVQQYPPCPGRSEALQCLRRAQLLIGLQIERNDEAGWRVAEALVSILEKTRGSLLWVGGREFFVDGAPLEAWKPFSQGPA